MCLLVKKNVCEWILYNARTQVFAKTLPMIYVEALHKTLEIIRKDTSRREKMWEVSRKLKKGLLELGYNVGEVLSPITPVYVPIADYNLAAMILMKLRSLGVFVTGVAYPVIPKGIILYRMIPTAAHTDEDIEITINAFRKVRDDMKLNLKTGKRG